MFVFPLTPYLQALGLEKDEMIQALGLSFTVCTIALAIGIGLASLGSVAFTSSGVAAVIASFAGMYAGSIFRARMERALFQRVLFSAFLLVGIVSDLREAAG